MSVAHAGSTKATPSPRGLRLLLSSAAVSITGDGVLLAAAPLMAASLTRDPFQVGLVASATYAAWIVVGLPAGALVDRWDRRRVMLSADIFRAVVIGGFALLVGAGLASIPALVTAIFLVGVGSCFFDPAAQSVMTELAARRKDTLTKANGALWAIDNFGRSLSGPPIGAVTFALGRSLPFAIDALSFLVSAVLVRLLPATPREKTEHPSLLTSVRSGMTYLARHRELRRLTFGMGAYNFGWNLGFATLVLFAQDKLGLGAVGYGILLASGAIGGVLAGWLTPKIATNTSATTAYGVALSAQAVVWSVVAMTSNPWIVGAAIVVLGGLSTGVSVIGGTARQLLTPDDLMGRVVSVTRLIGIGAAALGALSAGAISRAGEESSHSVGLVAPMFAATAFTLTCALAFIFTRQTSRS